MHLTVGERLGAYEILALGSGGMGEVYRARDVRVDRDVAIKVLPPRLARDEEARARLAREAKAVAAISHPNVLHLYEFEQAARAALFTSCVDCQRARLSAPLERHLPSRRHS